MPLYEYQCDACGHRFEAIQKFSDAPLEQCPKCGGAIHKLQSAPAFHLKGSGWYVTDYAKKDGGPPAKSGDATAAGNKETGTDGEKKDAPASGDSPSAAKTDKAGNSSSSPPPTGTPTKSAG